MSSTIVFSTPSRARHKVAFCTPFSARWFLFLDSSEIARERCAQASDAQSTHGCVTRAFLMITLARWRLWLRRAARFGLWRSTRRAMYAFAGGCHRTWVTCIVEDGDHGPVAAAPEVEPVSSSWSVALSGRHGDWSRSRRSPSCGATRLHPDHNHRASVSSTRGTLLVEVGDTCRVRAEICQAEDKTPASAAVKISDDLDVLLAFYDFPGRTLGRSRIRPTGRTGVNQPELMMS